tara:strand:+ start:210 stop:479 length:270 start_codon:yes stop_codon:yes gene_type:complete
MQFKLVQKEVIPKLQFTSKIPIKQHPDLLKQIKKATLLGNAHKRKVGIFFHDDDGLKKVETTIWASGKKFICLKGGVWVPIERLTEVRF